MRRLRKFFKSLRVMLCKHLPVFNYGDSRMLYDAHEHQLTGYLIRRQCVKCNYSWYAPELWPKPIQVRVSMKKAG